MTNYQTAWEAITGRSDEWAGCANREQVQRVSAALAEAERRGAEKGWDEGHGAAWWVTEDDNPYRADQIAQGRR